MNLLLSICFRSLIKEESNGCGKKSSLLKTIARMHGDILIQTSWTMQCMCSHEGDDHTATNRSCSYNRHCPKNIAVQLVNNGSHTQRERERTYTNLIANAIYNLPMGGCMGVRMWSNGLLHGIQSVLSITSIPNKCRNKCNDYSVDLDTFEHFI